MSGAEQGVQKYLRDVNQACIFAPCVPHTLNLTGVHASELCPAIATFFNNIDRVYAVFSVSPSRWEAMIKRTQSTLHSSSETRWCARIDAVKPFQRNLEGILGALRELLEAGKLTATAEAEVAGLIQYFSSFEAVLMIVFWKDVLEMFNHRSVLLQSPTLSLDKTARVIDGLVNELQEYRASKIHGVIQKAKEIAEMCDIEPNLKTGKRLRFIPKKLSYCVHSAAEPLDTNEEPLHRFIREVYYVTLDFSVEDLKRRSKTRNATCELFRPLLNLHSIQLDEVEMRDTCAALLRVYSADLDDNLVDEICHFSKVARDIFNPVPNEPLKVLNGLYELQLEPIFPQLCIALRLFCTIPISICSAERSFSKLKHIKTVLRTRMGQERLSALALLSIEHELTAHSLDFTEVIARFARDTVRRFPRVDVNV
jgi:hypothetical protein